MIIAGDIGGTKTNVALFEANGTELGNVAAQRSFPSGKYSSLEAILEEFVVEHNRPEISHACFGVAGPVVSGTVQTPNLAWVIRDTTLAKTLSVDSVGLINDLEATAYGIEALKENQLFTLNEGKKEPGHRGLIAAGTGLGMAGIFWDGTRYTPMASEGGHMEFAPRNEREIELLRYLTEKLNGHVSYERVLSGPGLFNIYSFLRDGQYYEEQSWLTEEIQGAENKTAAVSKAGLSGSSELAVNALHMFTEIYGAMAGNLALLLKSTGGMFIGGGIAPKILDKLQDGTFVRAYKDKGRLSALVESIPVHVILDDKTALYGAARCALAPKR